MQGLLIIHCSLPSLYIVEEGEVVQWIWTLYIHITSLHGINCPPFTIMPTTPLLFLMSKRVTQWVGPDSNVQYSPTWPIDTKSALNRGLYRYLDLIFHVGSHATLYHKDESYESWRLTLLYKMSYSHVLHYNSPSVLKHFFITFMNRLVSYLFYWSFNVVILLFSLILYERSFMQNQHYTTYKVIENQIHIHKCDHI